MHGSEEPLSTTGLDPAAAVRLLIQHHTFTNDHHRLDQATKLFTFYRSFHGVHMIKL